MAACAGLPYNYNIPLYVVPGPILRTDRLSKQAQDLLGLHDEIAELKSMYDSEKTLDEGLLGLTHYYGNPCLICVFVICSSKCCRLKECEEAQAEV